MVRANKGITMNFCRTLAVTSVLYGLFVLATASQAQDAQLIANAKRYLDTTHNAKQILMLAHLGADLKSYSYAGDTFIKDAQGRKVPGHFALVFDYDWQWNGSGYTRLAFLYDENGVIYDISVMATNGVANAPFELSGASIKLVGGIFIEAMRGNASAEELRKLEAAVKSANTKALLVYSIQIGQATGIRL